MSNMYMTRYQSATLVTPDDNANVNYQAFTVGTSNTITIADGLGASVALPAIAGVIYPVRVTKVFATGTTATGIVGFN